MMGFANDSTSPFTFLLFYLLLHPLYLHLRRHQLASPRRGNEFTQSTAFCPSDVSVDLEIHWPFPPSTQYPTSPPGHCILAVTSLGVTMQVTPAVVAALPNSGHPWLKIFADDMAAGNAESLVINLVPHWCAFAATPFPVHLPLVVCTAWPTSFQHCPLHRLAGIKGYGCCDTSRCYFGVHCGVLIAR